MWGGDVGLSGACGGGGLGACRGLLLVRKAWRKVGDSGRKVITITNVFLNLARG